MHSGAERADGPRGARDGEIARLASGLVAEDAIAGVRLLQIDGELGSGKSVFLTELLGAAIAAGIAPDLVLRAGGMLRGADDPYGALRPLLERVLGTGGEGGAFDDAEAVAARCAERMGNRRHVIGIDDADRLSSEELAVLTRLLGVPQAPPLALALTHRSAGAVHEIVTAARSRGAVHDHVTLAAVSDDALSHLAAGLEPHHSALVTASASGNPLFARVLCDAFRRSPGARDVDDALYGAAKSGSQLLLAVVARDFATMGADARRVLEALAVVGDDVRAAGIVSGLGPEAFAEGERGLRALRLLPERDGTGLHPVIRHSVRLHVDAGTRATLHRAAAGLPGRTAAVRAENLAQLGESMTQEEASELVDIAGGVCETAPAAVARWLRADTRTLRVPGAPLVLARALLRLGAAAEALEAVQAATAPAPTGPAATDPSADALLARVLVAVGQYDDAKGVLKAMPNSGAAARTAATLRESADAWMLIDGEAPSELLNRLHDSESALAPLVARTYEVFALLTSGDTAQARVRFADLVPQWQEAPDDALPGAALPLLFAAWSAHVLERFDDCRRLSARGILISRRHGRVDALAVLYAARAFSMMHLGRLDEADEAAETGARIAERVGPQGASALACSALVVSAHARASAGRGEQQLRERYAALVAAELPRMTWWRRVALSARSRASAVLGVPEPSPELASEAVDAMTALRYSDAARAAYRAGDAELSALLLEQARSIAVEQGLRGQEAMIDVQAAETLLRDGRVLEAKNLLLAARPSFADLDMVMLQQHVHILLARADQLLARRSALFASLTERELQVAELIAEGRKNREISARLVISQRTAENHVANVLRKLGIGNRQDLAAILADSGDR